MGRNIKIELELPEFENELNISVTLRKDGEVITASSPTGITLSEGAKVSQPAWKQSATDGETSTHKQHSSNMMNAQY